MFCAHVSGGTYRCHDLEGHVREALNMEALYRFLSVSRYIWSIFPFLEIFDSLRLPAGTHICTASYAISKTPANISNAQDFNGFRYDEKRKQPNEEHRYQYAVADKDHGRFGYGKFACPGRFFAFSELKIIVAHLIMEFDFKYPEDKTRPEQLNVVEVLHPDPSARLLIKRRSKT